MRAHDGRPIAIPAFDGCGACHRGGFLLVRSHHGRGWRGETCLLRRESVLLPEGIGVKGGIGLESTDDCRGRVLLSGDETRDPLMIAMVDHTTFILIARI